MPTLSQIELPNGTTYDIIDTKYSAGTGLSLSGTTFNHSDSVTAGTYRSVTVNATGHVTAGTNPTTLSGYGITDAKINNGIITLGNNTITPLTGTSDLKEEYLVWGGRNITGSISPVGASLSSEHSANRLAFINKDALAFEYSSNDGATWTSYTIANNDKVKFCTDDMTYSLAIGRPDGTTDVTLQSKTRITVTCCNGTTTYMYTDPKKLLINVSSAASLSVLIETRTGANYLNDGAWTTFGTYTLSGWSGWNDIPLILGTLGGGINQTSNNWQLRLTVSVTQLSTSSPKVAAINAIRLYGVNSWTTPSSLAKMGHLYSFDILQNVTFPANLKMNADKQVGYFTATPTTNQVIVSDGTTGGVKSSGYTIATSVPSGAVFTDTKNTAGSTDTSSKIYLVGTTSQAANPQTYSDNEVYTTSGTLTTNKVQVGGGNCTLEYNTSTASLDFIFL